MANDWIKMRHNLRRHGHVVMMAAQLNTDKLRVLGGLYAAWCLADEHTSAGLLRGYSLDALDAEIGFPGFAKAMAHTGWIEQTEAGVQFIRFEEHNGETAKQRVLKNARQARWRDGDAPASTGASTEAPTREEKRREEVKDSVLFDKFWAAWPNGKRKVDRKGCLRKWQSNGLDNEVLHIIAHVTSMKRSNDWTKSNGDFIPMPATYLNQRRWEATATPAPLDSIPFLTPGVTS